MQVMALDDILARIREDAAAEASRVIQEAKAQADSILEEAKRESEKIRKEALEQAGYRAEEIRKREFTLAELEIRKELLAARQEHIEAAFEKAVGLIQQMDEAKYLSLLKKALVRAATTDGGTLTLSPGDLKRISKSFLDEVNEELRASGKGPICLDPEPGNILGGFILKSGQVEVNNTIDAALKLTRDEIEPQVAEILFGE